MVAGVRDIAMAIESLTPEELLRIRAFAIWRMRGLGRRSHGKDHEDLMQEAVTRTIGGERRWNATGVSFAAHLLGAMRSISNHWAGEGGDDPALFAELDELAADGRRRNPVDRIAADDPGPEAQLAIKQDLEAVERLFAADAAALRVIACLRRGLSGPAVQEAIGCSKTEYETIMKRIRRRLRGAEPRGERR